MNIFITCGANDLQILDRLYHLSNHLEESYFYGKKWDKIYCFEPSEDFPKMNIISSSEPKTFADPDGYVKLFGNTKIEFIKKAVWIKNTKIDFYNFNSSRHYSNTICPDKGVHSQLGSKGRVTYEVDAIDFDEWLKENINKEDYVFCDMDIECSEYEILPHLIKNNSIELIDDLAIEWHSTKCGNWFKKGINKKLEKQLSKKVKVLNHDDIGFG
jgi:FkbM family methyltransferase